MWGRMRRREFMMLLSGVAATPLAVGAQQPEREGSTRQSLTQSKTWPCRPRRHFVKWPKSPESVRQRSSSAVLVAWAWCHAQTSDCLDEDMACVSSRRWRRCASRADRCHAAESQTDEQAYDEAGCIGGYDRSRRLPPTSLPRKADTPPEQPTKTGLEIIPLHIIDSTVIGWQRSAAYLNGKSSSQRKTGEEGLMWPLTGYST